MSTLIIFFIKIEQFTAKEYNLKLKELYEKNSLDPNVTKLDDFPIETLTDIKGT